MPVGIARIKNKTGWNRFSSHQYRRPVTRPVYDSGAVAGTAPLEATPLALGDGRTIPLNFSAGVAGAPSDGSLAHSAAGSGIGTPDAILVLAD